MANITLFTGAAAPGPTSEPVSTSSTLPYGSLAIDADGNMYTFVAFTGTCYGGSPVEILGDNTAAVVGSTGRGRVAVAKGTMTSDQAGWVQVYGRTLIHLGQSGVSPSDAANGPTTLSNSLATVFVLPTSATSPQGIGWVSGAAAANTSTLTFVVLGMHVAHDTSVGDVSGTTSATSHPGNTIAVWLNFPHIMPVDITT